MEKKTANLKSNIFFSTITQLILYLTPLIVAPYVSRVLGATGVGEYSYANSICYYFSIFIVFGFGSLGTRTIAANRDNKEKYRESFWSIFFSRGFIFLVVFILFFCLSFFNVFSTGNTSLMFALFPVLIGDFFDISFLFQGLEKFKIISVFQVITNVAYMILIFCCVKSYSDLFLYTLLKSSINLLTYLGLWICAIKIIGKPVFSLPSIRKTFIQSFFFFLPNIIMTISPMINTTLLGLLVDAKEVSYFEQPYKIISLVGSLIVAISPVMLSRISYLYENNKIDEAKDKLEKAIHLAYFIVIPAMVGLIIIARFFIPGFFGEEFTPSINIMYVLAISTIFSPISSIIINGYFYPMKKVKLVTVLMGCDVIVNLIINFFSIKYMGAMGAAITTVCISIICFVLYIIFSKDFINYKKILESLWKIVLSALIMTGFLLLINYLITSYSSLGNMIISIIDALIGMVIYFTCAVFLKEKDAILFINVINKKISHKNKKAKKN